MDQNQLEDITKQAKSLGADQLELLYIHATDVSTGIRCGKQESLERSEHQAISLRVWTGKTNAMVSSDDLDGANLGALIENAIAIAKASPADPHVSLAPPELWTQKSMDLQMYDAAEPSVEQLDAICHEAEDAARSIKGVTNSDGANAGYGHQHVTLMISPDENIGGGAPFVQSYKSSNYSMSVAVLAGEGTGMEEDYELSLIHI